MGEGGRVGQGAGGNRRADDGDLVVDDELLRQPLGVVGNAAIVLDDEVDFLAGNAGAVLVHVHLDAGLDLLADRGESAGQRHHDPALPVLSQTPRGRPRASPYPTTHITKPYAPSL